jgi:hypothetical protein
VWALRWIVALSALWALPAGATADVLIERVPCPGLLKDSNRASGCTGLRAEGGALLWSAYDPAANVYRLTARRAGITASVPVPPRRQPFDADLGRDARGRLVVTYSRCAGDAGGPARGCGAYETMLGVAGERRLLTRIGAPGELHPSRWGWRLAISAPPVAGVRDPAMCDLRRGTCARLGGGPRSRTSRGVRSAVIDTDLRGTRLALTWFVNPDSRPFYRRRYILLIDDVRHPVVHVLDKAAAGGAGNDAVFSPALTTGAVLWARGGVTCSYPSTPNLPGRYDLCTRRTRRVPSGSRLAAVAGDGPATFLLRCGSVTARPDSSTSADIVRALPDPFGPLP